MTETKMQTWPYPPGHRRHGEPKEPSIAAVRRMLEDDYGIKPPTVTERIKKNGGEVEVGDYDFHRKAFSVWLHVPGAAYPEKYWYEVKPVNDSSQQKSSQQTQRPRMKG